MRFPKHEYVRSRKLLNNVRHMECQHCGSDDGTVVAAHTNWGGGKGKGIKADDNLIAALCYSCHTVVDSSMLPRESRIKFWIQAHLLTVRNMVLRGLWPSEVPIPHNPEYDEFLRQFPADNAES